METWFFLKISNELVYIYCSYTVLIILPFRNQTLRKAIQNGLGVHHITWQASALIYIDSVELWLAK